MVMPKLMKSFIYKGCWNPVTTSGHTNIDIGVKSGDLELRDNFWYLDDTHAPTHTHIHTHTTI